MKINKIKNMRAKTVESTLSFSAIMRGAPEEIKDYVERLKSALQSEVWHPEGDSYIHTRLVFDRASESGDIDLMMGALFHDLGKADVTKRNAKGSWSAHGHEQVSEKLAIKYRDWIESFGADCDTVIAIVGEHMRAHRLPDMRQSKQDKFKMQRDYEKIMQFSMFDDMSTLTSEEMTRYR